MKRAATYRPMTFRDYSSVIALWRETPGIALHNRDDSREGIARHLRRNRGLSLVACQAGRVVGAVLVGHDGRRGHLYHLAVAPAHRKCGIGRELVTRALRNLARQHIAKCNIFVMPGNKQGLAFWKRLGWTLRSNIPWLQTVTKPIISA